MEHRINTLHKLEEDRELARKKFEKHQQSVKHWFDLKKSVSWDLEVGDLVLKWDKEHEAKENIRSSNACGWDHLLLQKNLVLELSGCRHWRVTLTTLQ